MRVSPTRVGRWVSSSRRACCGVRSGLRNSRGGRAVRQRRRCVPRRGTRSWRRYGWSCVVLRRPVSLTPVRRWGRSLGRARLGGGNGLGSSGGGRVVRRRRSWLPGHGTRSRRRRGRRCVVLRRRVSPTRLGRWASNSGRARRGVGSGLRSSRGGRWLALFQTWWGLGLVCQRKVGRPWMWVWLVGLARLPSCSR